MMEPKWLWLSVLLLFLLEGCRRCSTDACREDERIALLQLKPFFNPRNHLSSWVEKVKGSDCCEWEGVECSTSSSSRRVIGLSLNYTRSEYYWDSARKVNYSWYLNASLFLPFKELKRLYLPGNFITGCFENEDFAKLSTLGHLEILDLTSNYLNETILLSLSQLSSLKHLYLAYNSFTGSSHANGFQLLSRLGNLETLDLSGNFLKNDILFHLGSISSLKTLNLMDNRLEGMIYLHELNTLSNLKNLDLSNNRIESLGPSNQGKKTQLRLTNLELLDLAWNSLKNDILFHMGSLSSLKILYLSGNSLKGIIYIHELNTLCNLKNLYLDHNRIEGFRPSNQGSETKLRLTNLEVLYLNYNLLRNNTFSLIRGLSSLKSLSMQDNRLQGSIHIKDFVAFTNLKELDLSFNDLNEFVVKGLCDLRNLEELYIQGNALEGIIPYCFSNLTSLRVLDISDNQFTGNLTPLANLTSLRFISISRNLFQISTSFIPLANLLNLKVLLSDENKVVMEPNSFHTSVPKFQLNFISLSGCTTNQGLSLEPFKFLYSQYDLRYVDLSYNNFGGTFPFWLLENNTKLEVLFLMGNSLTGCLLLPQILNHNASSIDISNNSLQCQIPKNICSTFPKLGRFFLSGNAFEGNIPPCLSHMSSLSLLDLSNNHLSGRVPEELFMSSSLETLRLSNNNLSGKIVPTIFNSSMLLSELYLDGNNFAGEILDIDISSADFPHLLEEINLGNNRLHGKLPRWIGNLLSLKRLSLSNNLFEGSIPMELCNLYGLELLELSQNSLSGSIPSCFGQTHIRRVHLNGNRLSGQWTHAFYNCSSLVILDLKGNNLIGNIPEWIDTLSALRVLLLKANHLNGEIPIQLCNLYSLSIIDLSENMLSGPIPSCLGNLTLANYYKSLMGDGWHFIITTEDESPYTEIGSPQAVYRDYPSTYMEEWIEFTTKSVSLSYGGNVLNYMSGIDLSCNKLTGQIPNELGNLSGIHALNLSHNHLIGVIPSSFSKLEQIESLDLSYNNLSGRIPIQLVELYSLEVFNVAHNNLSGSVPEPKAQFGTFDESSYEGNPFLCGPLLHKNCSKTKSPSIVPTQLDEGEGSFIDTHVFCVTFLVSYVAVLLGIFVVLYLNPYWRQAWFSFIEGCITTCRYSIVGNLLELYIFKRCAQV